MFEAYGKSYEEALENSAKALFSIFGNAQPLHKASPVSYTHLTLPTILRV